MPIDFKSLLNSLAQGDDAGVADTVLARRKNAPPTMSLLPGQQAVADIVQGASDADGFTNKASLEQQGKSAPVFGQPTQATFSPTVQGPAVGQQTQQPVVGSNIPDTPEHEMYVNAQQQGVQDQPSNVDNTATVSPSLFNTPFDDSVRTQQGKYDQAVNAPIVKHSFWADLAAKAPKVAEAFVKGYRGDFGNIDPAFGAGRISHDTAVRNEGTKLGQLEQQQNYEDTRNQHIGTVLNAAQANVIRGQSAQNLADYREKLLTQKNLTDTQRNDLLKERNRLTAAGIKQNALKIKQIDDKLNETVRHNKAIEGLQSSAEEGRNNRTGMVEQGRADRAKARLQNMDARSRQTAIDGAVTKWMEQNPGYSADDLKNVRDNLMRIYGQP